MGKKGGFLKGLIFGSLVGSIVGVLFAPKPGKDLREELRKRYITAKTQLDKKLKELKPKTQEAYNKIVREVLTGLDKVKKIEPKDFEALRKKLEATWEDFSKKLSVKKTTREKSARKSASRRKRARSRISRKVSK